MLPHMRKFLLLLLVVGIWAFRMRSNLRAGVLGRRAEIWASEMDYDFEAGILCLRVEFMHGGWDLGLEAGI